MSSPLHEEEARRPQPASKPGAHPRDGSGAAPSGSDDAPGVPGFRTWRGVYLFVFGAFVLMVIALAIFSRVFA